MGCGISLKLHMLHSHLKKFEDTDHEVRFNQNQFKHRYQADYDENMMKDSDIWTFICKSDSLHKRETRRIKMFGWKYTKRQTLLEIRFLM